VAPVLQVSALARAGHGESRDIVVDIRNGDTVPILILPNLVRLRIEGARAEYVPRPGPPVDPWQGALQLAPDAGARLRFADASDKSGVWRLPPGDYRIVAVYEVPRDLLPASAIAGPGRLWRGRIESPSAAMTVVQAR